MIISLNWLKKFTSIDVPIDDLATLIGARLVEIESTTDLGAKYKDALVVKVIKAEKLQGSDHLSVTKIDDGGVTNDIERDTDGLIQVVCGAPNIAAGQTVVWLPPKSTVPETYGKTEPFILGSRKLCGVISNGMIASARELDLFDEHQGILELKSDIAAGTLFASAFEYDDYLFDIANKSLTHRPDCFGIVGFAREVAAIQGKEFKTPEWLEQNAVDFTPYNSNQMELNVVIDDSELSSRYLAVVMSDTNGNAQSPMEVQTYLSRVGLRPINAVVDVTNYLMMLTGQPLHAFDYDKVVALNNGKAEIHVRSGRDGEELTLLDGRTIKLSTGDIVIASGETAIGLAGAMGGASTAIDDNTKNIIIESATFNLYNLRSTQMRHGIFSEAITRFTKGQPAELSAPVLLQAIKLMQDWAGAKPISGVVEAYPGKTPVDEILVSPQTINDILGSDYTQQDISQTLKNVGFTVNQKQDDNLGVIAPYWRADIHIIEDIVEEVGRLNGFDNINPTLPNRTFNAVTPYKYDEFRNRVRGLLVRSGANEVLTYSFIHGNLLQKVNQDISNSYRIVNSISPDLQYYRQSLTPSLLELIHPNIKQGYGTFSIFEMNKVNPKINGLSDEGVPVEIDKIGFVFASKNNLPGAAYYQSKKVLDYVLGLLGVNIEYLPLESDASGELFAPFEYRRSAKLIDKNSGLVLGVIGEYKKSVSKGLKLPEYVSGFEINAQVLYNLAGNDGGYKPLSRYPSTERDVCFKVDDSVQFASIIETLNNAKKNIDVDTLVSPVDIYKSENSTTKNITVRIKLTSHDHTLTGVEVSSIVDPLIAQVVSANNAVVI